MHYLFLFACALRVLFSSSKSLFIFRVNVGHEREILSPIASDMLRWRGASVSQEGGGGALRFASGGGMLTSRRS